MSASPVARGRKRYREEATAWARAYLNVKRLPNGVPELIRSWAAVIGPEVWERPDRAVTMHWLVPTLKQYRKPFRGV